MHSTDKVVVVEGVAFPNPGNWTRLEGTDSYLGNEGLLDVRVAESVTPPAVLFNELSALHSQAADRVELITSGGIQRVYCEYRDNNCTFVVVVIVTARQMEVRGVYAFRPGAESLPQEIAASFV